MSVISVQNLRKVYGSRVAVSDVSFSVDEGEIFGIVGRNGAGKTTTVECVAGLRTPDAGTVRVAATKAEIGVQLQDAALPDKLKAGEAVDLYASFYGASPEGLLDEVGVPADVPFAKLSGGQRQRLSIALALAGRPKIAIFDELTTGLDPQARRDTWELISKVRERGVTVLLVTHFMEEIERLCDRVAVLAAGEVVALDTPAGLIARVGGTVTATFRTAHADLLRTIPDVTSVRVDGGLVTVTGGSGLVKALVAAVPDIDDLRTERATLDDAFLMLTGDES